MASTWTLHEGKVVAFLDIGTNSLRLLLVRINPNRSYTVLSDQKETVRLGEGEFIDQNLQPEAMQRAVLVAHKFAAMAQAYGAEEIIAVATSATREAENRDDFIRRLKRTAELEVHTISGREEARLIYLGVVNGVHLGDKQALFIDIGGGSTELIVGSQEQYQHLDSLKLGAIRLTSLFFLPEETGSVPPGRYALIQQYVRATAVRTVQQVRQFPIDIAFGSSGTIENLADIAAQRFLKRKRQRDDVLTHGQLKQVVEVLCALPLDERRSVQGITESRADIIIAGAAIIDTLMEEIGLSELHVSERGLRDGLLIDYLSRSEHEAVLEGASVRARSVLQLGRACGFDEEHAHHVAELALDIFDSAKEIGLHRYGDRERELLEYTALLHDVGSFLSYTNHHQHSYYLIRNADLLGFDQMEIGIMAAAALFHRKSMPRKKHPEFASLDQRSQDIVRLFALLLRLAESLDRSHTGAIHSARLLQKGSREVLLELHARHDPQLEVWGVQNHSEVFDKTFRRKLVVETVLDQGEATAQIPPEPAGAEDPGG